MTPYEQGYITGLEKVGVSREWVEKMLGPKNVHEFTSITPYGGGTPPTEDFNKWKSEWFKAESRGSHLDHKYPRTSRMLNLNEPFSDQGMRKRIMQNAKKTVGTSAHLTFGKELQKRLGGVSTSSPESTKAVEQILEKLQKGNTSETAEGLKQDLRSLSAKIDKAKNTAAATGRDLSSTQNNAAQELKAITSKHRASTFPTSKLLRGLGIGAGLGLGGYGLYRALKNREE
ncbi:hypothetical protein [Neptuniibacter sp.]|uniref:hypothetical protein n=1 Tax=Neptuniibacter sp. TaxID=1962643 RepID=UPI0026182184|nr:hypothetical protein [Neptuniibacter sp.]MCP4595613.1 hypothetical protein [Neptuniibacter sp.]